MHPKDYERYVALKEEERAQMYRDRKEYLAEKMSKFEQNDFNRIVLNFMINGMHEPSLLEDPTFATLLNGNFHSVKKFVFSLYSEINNERKIY